VAGDTVDEAAYKRLKKKILDVNAVISKLDSAIRGDAFVLLRPYLTEDAEISLAKKTSKAGTKQQHTDHSDATDLIQAHPDGSPADNVVLIAAYLYGKFGTQPFSASEIRQLGDSFGVTVPHRIDNTLRVAKREGKRLFQKVGKQFKPTVNGEAHFKTEYRVAKGHEPRPVEAES
jgi:hypothetical protein